jgi:hypothetical protein
MLRGTHPPPNVERDVRACRRVALTLSRSARTLLERGWVAAPTLLSSGGSAFFDRVVGSFAPRTHATTVLPSGCYVTQDGGYYDEMSPLAGRHDDAGPRLRNALEVWGIVLSRPEPTPAIASFGKRDVAIDLGPPTPVKIRRQQGKIEPARWLRPAADANAAAAAFIRNRFGAERIEERLRARDKDGSAFRSLVGRLVVGHGRMDDSMSQCVFIEPASGRFASSC